MDALVALALSIGILIAGWTYVALGPGALPVWAGIVAWGCFFAAGGKTEGLMKTIASNLSGVLWAFLALTAWNRFGGGVPVLSVLVGRRGDRAWCCRRRSPPSASFPARSSARPPRSASWSVRTAPGPRPVVALVIGAVLGYLSEMLAGALTGRSRPRPNAQARRQRVTSIVQADAWSGRARAARCLCASLRMTAAPSPAPAARGSRRSRCVNRRLGSSPVCRSSSACAARNASSHPGQHRRAHVAELRVEIPQPRRSPTRTP